jgi:hypothetical protein
MTILWVRDSLRRSRTLSGGDWAERAGGRKDKAAAKANFLNI